MALLAAPRLELRLRPAPRPRQGRRVHGRGRRRRHDHPRLRREHERPAHDLLGAGRLVRAARLRPRFVLYNRAFKPSMLAADHPAARRRPPGGRPLPARLRLRPDRRLVVAVVEPHRVHRPRHAAPADDERAAHLRRGRAAVPARPRLPPGADLRRAARGGPRGHGRALPREHGRALARLGEAHACPARLPARGDPLGARAEAPPVRGHGRAARRHDDEPARAPGLRPHVGLPLLLAPRLVLHAERARAARSCHRDGAFPRLPAQPRRGARRRAPARLHDLRRRRGRGDRAATPRRLPGRAAGPDRQPGLPPPPERRLRRDDPGGQPARARRALHRVDRDAARRGARRRAARADRDPARGARRRARGSCAACGGSTASPC